jgi:transposase, IS5 family
MHQVEMVSLEDLVSHDHLYRQFLSIWNFKCVMKRLAPLQKNNPNEGYGLLRLFKCLLLQFAEDLSDRELEQCLKDNVAAKFFCDFGLTEKTPDHTVFCRTRKRIQASTLSKIFSDLREQLKKAGVMREVFSFVDATHLIAKANLWEERDKALAKKYEKLNNDVLPEVAYDKEARIGCKGKKKFWYGYKAHTCVDMQSGLINRVAITPANLTDANGFKHACPRQGAVYADKGYCVSPAIDAAMHRGCDLRAIKKNNMAGKNKDLDRWLTGIRSPYERVFSQRERRVRYAGVAKNQFAAYMQAIAFNLKRLVILDIPLLEIA